LEQYPQSYPPRNSLRGWLCRRGRLGSDMNTISSPHYMWELISPSLF
jgi:hypothetical protein